MMGWEEKSLDKIASYLETVSLVSKYPPIEKNAQTTSFGKVPFIKITKRHMHA